MTTPIELGWDPYDIAPRFTYDQDWIVAIEPIEGSVSPVYPPPRWETTRTLLRR